MEINQIKIEKEKDEYKQNMDNENEKIQFSIPISNENIPSFLKQTYINSNNDIKQYDASIHKYIQTFIHELNDIDVIMGIPFYMEVTNIVSVLVTLREVFQTMKSK
jgi:hypothetical protein